MEYCVISAQTPNEFLLARQIQGIEMKKSLIERMHESIKNGYTDFLNILQEDANLFFPIICYSCYDGRSRKNRRNRKAAFKFINKIYFTKTKIYKYLKLQNYKTK